VRKPLSAIDCTVLSTVNTNPLLSSSNSKDFRSLDETFLVTFTVRAFFFWPLVALIYIAVRAVFLSDNITPG
jgi:hypothetical protein